MDRLSHGLPIKLWLKGDDPAGYFSAEPTIDNRRLGLNAGRKIQADEAGLKFMVMNAGPGIADHLKSGLSSINGRQAIYLACREGVSSEDSGGLGLFRTVQLVQQAGGYLYIHSGRDRVVFDPQKAWVSRKGNFSSRSFLWGTQIGVALPKKTRE